MGSAHSDRRPRTRRGIRAVQTRAHLHVRVGRGSVPCAGVEDRYKAYFPVTAEAFFWAMGHVLSRSFASHPQLGLAPFIDLINHDASASHPELAWDEDEAEDEREYFYYVTSSQGGKVRTPAPASNKRVPYQGAVRPQRKKPWLPTGLWMTSARGACGVTCTLGCEWPPNRRSHTPGVVCKVLIAKGPPLLGPKVGTKQRTPGCVDDAVGAAST